MNNHLCHVQLNVLYVLQLSVTVCFPALIYTLCAALCPECYTCVSLWLCIIISERGCGGVAFVTLSFPFPSLFSLHLLPSLNCYCLIIQLYVTLQCHTYFFTESI